MLIFKKSEKIIKHLINICLIIFSTCQVFGNNTQNEDSNINNKWSYEENFKAINAEIKNNSSNQVANKLSYLYSEKAALLYTLNRYKESLDNYILAHQYADKSKDEYNYYSILYGMALIKQQLQEYNDAEKLLIECKTYFEKNIDDINFRKGFVNTVGRLSYIYIIKKDINKSSYYNNIEMNYIIDSVDYYYAIKNKGLIENLKKNYIKSNSLLSKSKSNLSKYTSWIMIINQYIGENYYYLGEKQTAKKYYEKVVQMYLKERILSNEIRLSFERLIEYYKATDNQKMQLIYIDHLLNFDKEFNETNKFLAKSYYQDYETKNLIEEKNNIIQHIKYKNTLYIIAIIVVFTAVCASFYGYYTKQNKKLKASLDELDNQINTKKKERKPKKVSYKKPENTPINTDLEEKIIDFENEKGFLNPNLTIEILAKELKTNRTTLSQHINQSRDKTFTNYINSLRVNYIIEQIVADPKTKNYTMETLAEMAGFNNRKTFSDCFIQNTGLRPSYFIKNTRHL